MSKVRMIIPKQVSPISAIRKKCLDCCGGGRKEVSECDIYRCPLFPYRFGVMPETFTKDKNEDEIEIINEKGTVVKNVRRKVKS